MTVNEMLLRYWFKLESKFTRPGKEALCQMVMPLAIWYMMPRETQLPFLTGCGFSHAGRRPSAGGMQKSPGQKEAEPGEGKPTRDTDSLRSFWREGKLPPALPSLLLDHVQDSESSSPQLRRILFINKEFRAVAEWNRPEAVACSNECGTLEG